MSDFKNIAAYGRRHLDWDDTPCLDHSDDARAALRRSDMLPATNPAAALILAEAQVHATLALVEQQEATVTALNVIAERMLGARLGVSTPADACPCCSHTEGRHYDGCLEASE